MTAVPIDGTTRAHVERLLTEALAVVGAALARVGEAKRIRPAEREALSRGLAGVVGTCETVRMWLSAGAP